MALTCCGYDYYYQEFSKRYVPKLAFSRTKGGHILNISVQILQTLFSRVQEMLLLELTTADKTNYIRVINVSVTNINIAQL